MIKSLFLLLLIAGGSFSACAPAVCEPEKLKECVAESDLDFQAAYELPQLPECGFPRGFEKPADGASNAAIRRWYVDLVSSITSLDKDWQAAGVTADKRALCAYLIRHHARLTARALMSKPEEVKALQARDMAKYGNPDGPTFCWLVQKNCAKGMSEKEVFEAIVSSSARTNQAVDERVIGNRKEAPAQ